MDGIERWDNVQTLRVRPGEPMNMLSLAQCQRILSQNDLKLERFQVYGFSGRAHAGAKLFSALAKVPLLKEVFHSYYTALLRKPGG
jgi:hypothetical protein